MVAYTTIVAYNLYRGYPFASFGDTVMCLLQVSIAGEHRNRANGGATPSCHIRS